MRKIAVLTGTRADYGLLRGLLQEIEADEALELQLIVTGTHLSDAFGRTESEIEDDGLRVAASVPIWSADDSRLGAAEDVGSALPRYARVLTDLAPDILVVLGDRLEAFAAAAAATVVSVPLAHIHGGELTEGAMDDALRHSITKMAYLHFTSTEDHRRRVIQMGEQPDRVYFHGAPIVDALSALELLPREEVERRFGVRLSQPTALVTFHPAVMDVDAPEVVLEELLVALLEVDGLHVVVTGSNSDIGTADVRQRIAAFVESNTDRVDFVESFGQLGYLSAMSAATVVAGNSSSTVLEAPVLGTPSVLVGDRQKGRPLASSVATPDANRTAIASALRDAIRGVQDQSDIDIFGHPGFAARTAATLRDATIPTPPRKKFHDLEEGSGS
ncbi:UDP-N-acetylglucosamine 2-epimerase [Microbacterium murale]|uniref:UDP-N-acetyl glucosamine 2-epimerase n=1 Tax=Microbacterium murale TaxID=1081040 RepID=A0ABQ1RLL8_9MICO|nr:UDP-N-acetylglucosamine 2-epimerase [Microbacterium murale]GGD72330.1 UDP-N-acetyl glucosamine 2-epimerase [Microbacterium murale]